MASISRGGEEEADLFGGDGDETSEDGNGNEDGKDEGMNITTGNTAASDGGAVRAAAVADAGKVLMQRALSDDDANDAVPRSRPDGEAGHPGGETAVGMDAAETKASSSLKPPVPRKTMPVDPGVCVHVCVCVNDRALCV